MTIPKKIIIKHEFTKWDKVQSDGFNKAIEKYHKGIDEADIESIVTDAYYDRKTMNLWHPKKTSDKIRALLKGE